ncbi:MAG: hypothetical protein KBA46_03500 [Candidatus Omnitrophica bacterium]|nr:hypothetical protein [Candidatus Omnitrophota bacterium]
MKKAMTMLELIVALSLTALVMVGLFHMDVFARFRLMSSERRTVVQNEASLILEHMTRNCMAAIGNEIMHGSESVIDRIPGGVRVYVDAGDGQWGTAGDHWIQYELRGNNLIYCSNVPCAANNQQTLSSRVFAFDATNPPNPLQSNFLTVGVETRFNPARPVADDNPRIIMNTSIPLPSVTTR